MADKDSFIFYRSFFEASKPLSSDEKLALFEAIAEYALNHKKILLPPMAEAMFCLIKPQLEANYKKFQNGKKGGKYGNLGGRPKNEKPLDNPLGDISGNPKETPNANVNDHVNVNANLNANYNIKDKLQYGTVLQIEAMRTGLDIDYLYERFDRWIIDKDKPKDADSAFLAWVKKFSKGKAA